MDLARAPCRAPLTARKKGSGYENGLALVSICEIDVTSFSEDGRGVNGYVTNPNPTPTLTLTLTATLTLTLTKLMKKSRKKQL